MATHLDYDMVNRVVYVTTAPTAGELTLDVQVDIYSDMKEDWKNDANLGKFKFPLEEPVGGNVLTATKKISPYYFVKYGWSFRPYEQDHSLFLQNAALVLVGGGNPWIPTVGSYQVMIRDILAADAFTVGSGTAPPSAAEVAAAVWDSVISGHDTASTFGRLINDLIKLTGHKVTKTGDVITIYEANGVDTWRQYNLANDGRVQV